MTTPEITSEDAVSEVLTAAARCSDYGWYSEAEKLRAIAALIEQLAETEAGIDKLVDVAHGVVRTREGNPGVGVEILGDDGKQLFQATGVTVSRALRGALAKEARALLNSDKREG